MLYKKAKPDTINIVIRAYLGINSITFINS